MTDAPNALAQTEDFEFSALDKAENYRAALIREFSPYLQGDVLEVGAGVGQISAGLTRLGTIRKLVAIEPEPRFCRAFRVQAPNLTLVEGTIDNLPDDSNWDAIVSVNVLEHIDDDASELARYHRRLTHNRGHLCLFVPARQEIYAPIDRDFGHFRRYAKPELRRKLESAGFRIIRLNYFNVVGYFAWWMNFCLLRKRHFDIGSVVFFDRAVFPIVHMVETRLLRPPFGQSLIAVAQAA